MNECRFCSGKPIAAELRLGGGIQTMSMMLDQLCGMFGKTYEEQNEVSNGIQLAKGNILTFDNSAREYSLLGIEIKCCPMCGRILEAEEGEEDDE